jgi:hypothetical protein
MVKFNRYKGFMATFFFALIFCITLTSAFGVNIPQPTIPVNYSLVNVNNSNFLQGFPASYFYQASNPFGFYNSTTLDLSGYVPYEGATANLNLSNYNVTAGYLGLGTYPTDNLHIKTTTTQTTPQVYVEQDGTGDASMELGIVGDSWIWGIDNSDTDYLKLAYSSTQGSGALGSNDRWKINTNGDLAIGGVAPAGKVHTYTNEVGVATTHGRFENINTQGRTQFIVTSGTYPENFFALMTHGQSLSTTHNYYPSTIAGKNSDAGKGILLGQGNSMAEFIIGTYNDKPLGFFVNNIMKAKIDSTSGMNVLVPLNVTGQSRVNLNNVDYTNTNGAGSALYISNPNANGQNVVYSEIKGKEVAKWRTDYVGGISWTAGNSADATGNHQFWVQGGYPSGINALNIYNSGNVGVGTHWGTDNGYNLEVAGTTHIGGATTTGGSMLVNEISPLDNSVMFEVNGKGGFHNYGSTPSAYFADANYAGYFTDANGNSVTLADGNRAGEFYSPSNAYALGASDGMGNAVAFCDQSYAMYISSGNLYAPTSTATFNILDVTYYGTFGDTNSVTLGMDGDQAGLFSDGTNIVTIADGTNALVTTGQSIIALTSTGSNAGSQVCIDTNGVLCPCGSCA